MADAGAQPPHPQEEEYGQRNRFSLRHHLIRRPKLQPQPLETSSNTNQPKHEVPDKETAGEPKLKEFLGKHRTTKFTTSTTPFTAQSTGAALKSCDDSVKTSVEMADSTEHHSAQTNGVPPSNAVPEPERLSALDQLLNRVGSSYTNIKTVLRAVQAPLPTQTGDGSVLPTVPNVSVGRDLATILKDVEKLGIHKLEELAEVFEKAKLGQPLDDKKYLMEYLIQAAACLPDDLVSKNITNSFLTTLWTDIEHPPQMLLSEDFVFRQPDGSNNSYALPRIGAAGMPYARTVTPKTLRAGAMPDPGVLFDTVMARKEPQEHPNRISSVLFYLASIIIHDAFKTNRKDFNISDTSSYLDLAPLYGSNWKEQRRMRTFKDGKLKPDCFSETRLLQFPPGCGAILIMFNRYHNYVVEQLAAINEDERFTEDPKNPTVKRYEDPEDPESLQPINKRDDDLFQTARLITCGLYINIILNDYVRTILNLNRTNDTWQLNPRAEIPGKPLQGSGNQVSCEFNLVYRWHAAISTRDEAWTEALWKESFEGISPNMKSTADMGPLLTRLGEIQHKSETEDPVDRPFPALKSERFERIADGPFKGNFKDDDLAAVLSASVEDCANAMGPQQIPTVMKAIEILGILQARTWKVATLNEFRTHFGLEPHQTFESITSNKEVSDALKHLYDTPNNVELYPGLVLEDAKRPEMPGSGLCPSYTVSRAVLSDAVSLVRGDRYYTTSYTPAALTNWGYTEASSDLTIDNGCVFYKLFLRALPNSFDEASVYVHYPMTVPQGKNGMQEILTLLGKADMYNFDKPKPIVQPAVTFSYDAAMSILNDQEAFHVTWGKAMEFLMGAPAKNFMLAGDEPANTQSRNLMAEALYLGSDSRAMPTGNEPWLKAVRDFYEQITIQLLAQKNYKLGGVREVDIVRDVGNLAHVHFAAEMFSIPVKTDQFPRGIFTEQQLYLILAVVFICIFFDVDPPKSFPLRQQAHEATQQFGQLMELQVSAIKSTGKFAKELITRINPIATPLQDYGVHMIAKLLKKEPNVKNLVWGNILGTLGGMVAPQGQLFGQVMDFYLHQDPKYLADINKLAKEDTPEADEKLMHYLMEGARLNGETGVMRWVEKDTTIEDKTEIKELPSVHHFKSGDKILVNLKSASRDRKAFGANADDIDLTRSLDSYFVMGHGVHQCLGLPMTRVALTTMLKVVGRLDNLKAAPVTIGNTPAESQVKKVLKEFVPGDMAYVPKEWHYHAFLTEDWDMYFPFPTSLKVTWEDEASDEK